MRCLDRLIYNILDVITDNASAMTNLTMWNACDNIIKSAKRGQITINIVPMCRFVFSIWYLSTTGIVFVLFFPVECKWKQSNCNILQIVHIHNVLSRLCICANKIKKFQFQKVMFFFFMMRKSSIYSRHMSDWVSFIKPHTSYLICCLNWTNAPKTGFLNGYMHL